jgi:hypothetical protein
MPTVDCGHVRGALRPSRRLQIPFALASRQLLCAWLTGGSVGVTLAFSKGRPRRRPGNTRCRSGTTDAEGGTREKDIDRLDL